MPKKGNFLTFIMIYNRPIRRLTTYLEILLQYLLLYPRLTLSFLMTSEIYPSKNLWHLISCKLKSNSKQFCVHKMCNTRSNLKCDNEVWWLKKIVALSPNSSNILQIKKISVIVFFVFAKRYRAKNNFDILLHRC